MARVAVILLLDINCSFSSMDSLQDVSAVFLKYPVHLAFIFLVCLHLSFFFSFEPGLYCFAKTSLKLLGSSASPTATFRVKEKLGFFKILLRNKTCDNLPEMFKKNGHMIQHYCCWLYIPQK